MNQLAASFVLAELLMYCMQMRVSPIQLLLLGINHPICILCRSPLLGIIHLFALYANDVRPFSTVISENCSPNCVKVSGRWDGWGEFLRISHLVHQHTVIPLPISVQTSCNTRQHFGLALTQAFHLLLLLEKIRC